MNIRNEQKEDYSGLAAFFQAMGQPARLQLLAALQPGEACVCHLEVLSGQRQAYISQQLGVLKRAGLVVQRREGKHIYYMLANPQVTTLVETAARITGLNTPEARNGLNLPIEGCSCPACQSATTTGLSSLISLQNKKELVSPVLPVEMPNP